MKTVTLFSDVRNDWKSAGTKDSPNVLRARNNGSRLQQGSLRLDIKKHFWTVKIVKHWNRLPGETAVFPSFGGF